MSRRKRDHRRRGEKNEVKRAVTNRINELIVFSRRIYSDYPDQATRSMKTARKMAMKINLKLDRRLRLTHCKKCGVPFNSSTTTVRTAKRKPKKVIYSCKNCGFRRRYHY